MTGPRTAKEALIAELLGDMDKLIARAENLPLLVASSEEKLTATTKVLEDAGEKYRQAVMAFTEQAKSELSNHLDANARKAEKLTVESFEKQKAALQEAVKKAFESETVIKAINKIKDDNKKTRLESLITNTLIAFGASGFTAIMFYLMAKPGFL